MQMKQIPLTQTLACSFYQWGQYLGGGIMKRKTKQLNHLGFLEECAMELTVSRTCQNTERVCESDLSNGLLLLDIPGH